MSKQSLKSSTSNLKLNHSDAVNPDLEHQASSSSMPDLRKSHRRREGLVARIERIRELNLKRREEIYAKAWKDLNDTQNALMSNPPTEINYLVRLHRESLKREQDLVAVRVYHDHLISAARAAFEAEVKSIEEEFNNARKQAREKLLESLEERRKKLKDEKDLVDFNEEAVGLSHRSHTTRGLRNRSSNRTIFSRASPALGAPFCYPQRSTSNCGGPAETYANNHDHHLNPGDHDPSSSNSAVLPSSSTQFITADDPLSMAALNVNPHLRQSPIFQQLLHLNSNHHYSRRGGGGSSRRAPTGLPGPISLISITPGTWNNFHKSQLGICSAKIDDADADLEEIRQITGLNSKKSSKNQNGTSHAHNNGNSYENSNTLTNPTAATSTTNNNPNLTNQQANNNGGNSKKKSKED
ncbi:hypothetical protein O181_035154 [Austropuccinia psidii MF-1]|uniref:Uncharacterized protein n=1 Tax=Austropuccinia psidii MF-1 TaxID=1389203 RepID=A0A9Q3D244_9BASI|nr:hypothetical protein [Austropuccinia psidii MF-1]